MDYPIALRALNQLSQDIRQAEGLDQLLWGVTKACTPFLQLDDLVIYTLKEKEATLIQRAASGSKCGQQNSIVNPLQIPVGKGIVGISALTRQVQKVDDTRQNLHYLIDDQERRSELAVPIIWNDQLIGVIDSEHDHPGFFSSNYVDIFGLIASICAPMMYHFQQKEKRSATTSNSHYQQFIDLLEKEKYYRQRQLSLEGLAQIIGISPVYLSSIINQASGQSFNSIVNQYRIAEVKELIHKGMHNRYNILALAFQAGFNSKSSFNHNFRLHTQMTPTEFIKQLTH